MVKFRTCSALMSLYLGNYLSIYNYPQYYVRVKACVYNYEGVGIMPYIWKQRGIILNLSHGVNLSMSSPEKCTPNPNLVQAIQSLDFLNDQIVQYIFSSKSTEIKIEHRHESAENLHLQDSFKTSLVLMRQLLVDAQAKFRKMMEDNKQLASRIDSEITLAQDQVNILRTELADTNKRINEITGTFNNMELDNCPFKLENSNQQSENQLVHEISQLREENKKLTQQNRSLQREVEELRNLKEKNNGFHQDCQLKEEVEHLVAELNNAKEALAALKADRKRLKAEKFDLLNQMKQLYCTLEDKEIELREFIRNYEQRIKDSEEGLKQLASQKEEAERENSTILKQSKEESERTTALRAQLGLKETQLKQMEMDLLEAKEKLAAFGCTLSIRDHSSDANISGKMLVTPPACNLTDSQNFSFDETPSHTFGSPDPNHLSKGSIDLPNDNSTEKLPSAHGLSRSAEELCDNLADIAIYDQLKKKKKKSHGTWGSISRVFAKRHRKALDPNLFEGSQISLTSSPYVTQLSEENLSEKLKLVEQASGVPMENWKAATVLAWIEISLRMPMYAQMCAKNIKSGKVLLGLSDSELEAGLGITNPIHRRKLRLAIEEHRHPSLCKFPKAGDIDDMWVCHHWLPSLGLGQYAELFHLHLIDGRVLNTLTRKDMEKHLGMTRKFLQISLLRGIELLRLLDFDKQILSERRSQTDNIDGDPLVWSNERFIKWTKSIDLDEYADNLKESGVHGAMAVLETSFTADTMATALGIPPSKTIVRRHLMTEFEALILPARISLDNMLGKGKLVTGYLGRSFMRFYSGGIQETLVPSKKQSTFRGSLTRVFGRKLHQDIMHSPSFDIGHSDDRINIERRTRSQSETISSVTTV